ncbi:hypothetical protein [Bacillus sp. NEAU-Y102]
MQTAQLTEDERKKLQEVIDMFDAGIKKNEDKDAAFAMGLKLTNAAGTSGFQKLFDACRTLFGSVPKQYESALADLEATQGLQEDILHALELLKDVDFDKAGKDLNIIRQHRRHAKDYMEITEPIWKLSQRYPGILNEIAQIQGHVKKVKEKHEARTYTPRELSSLAIAFQLADSIKEEDKNVVLQKQKVES